MKGKGFKTFDILIILAAVICITVISVSVYGGGNKTGRLTVRTEDGTAVYSLEDDRIIEAAGPLGVTVIEIQDGVARVVTSPCRDKLCILKGRLEKAGDWTACMPNRVFVQIGGSADGGVDEVSY